MDPTPSVIPNSVSSVAIISILLCAPAFGAAKQQIYKVPKAASGSFVMYSHPTVHSDKIKKIPANARWIAKLSGIKEYSRETWLQVSWNGKKGWVKQNQLVFDPKATDMAAKDPKCLLEKTCDLSE